MSDRTSIILEDGVKRLRTENDTLSIGYKSFDDARAYASLTVTGSANGSVNGTYTQDAAYNGVNTYVNGGLTIFFTGKLWALHTATTNNYWDCMYTCGSQLGIYKEVAGSEELGVFGSTEDLGSGDVSGTLITSNGIFAATYLTTDILTLNQARFYFENNTNKLDIIESNSVAFLTKTDDNSTFGIPTGNRNDWAIQTFQSLLIGVNSCDVSTTNFDATFIPCTGPDLGVTEWIYTSNFRTDGTHYTDNLVEDDSLEIAGIEHNTYLGLQVNTPATLPGTGNIGNVVFPADIRRTQVYYSNWFHITGKPYPEFPDWRQLGNMYDAYMDAMDEYRAYYVSKRTASPSVETVNLTTNITTGTQKFTSKLSLSDGGCYFPSYQASSGLYIAPGGYDSSVNSNALETMDPCLNPVDGLIYHNPYTTTNIRTQDVNTFTLSTVNDVPGANWTSLGFIGSVIADDGTVHFLPCALDNEAAKISVNNTVTMYGNGAVSANEGRSFQAVVNNGGILYTPPTWYIDGDWYMRKVDPVAEAITDIPLFTSANGLVNGLACPYKEKILFVGYTDNAATTGLYYFDTTDNSYGIIGSAQIYANAGKGFLAPDGCYYFSDGSGYIIRADIEANTTTNTGLAMDYIIILSSDGYVYSLSPIDASDLSTFKRVKLFDVPIDPNFLCNRYLNTT